MTCRFPTDIFKVNLAEAFLEHSLVLVGFDHQGLVAHVFTGSTEALSPILLEHQSVLADFRNVTVFKPARLHSVPFTNVPFLL